MRVAEEYHNIIAQELSYFRYSNGIPLVVESSHFRYSFVPYRIIENALVVGNLDDTFKHNEAHTTREFVRAAEELSKMPQVEVTFSGYVVSPPRPDYRTAIDSIQVTVPKVMTTLRLEQYVAGFARLSDEFSREEVDGNIVYTIWWD